jgi:hypothetical protein
VVAPWTAEGERDSFAVAEHGQSAHTALTTGKHTNLVISFTITCHCGVDHICESVRDYAPATPCLVCSFLLAAVVAATMNNVRQNSCERGLTLRQCPNIYMLQLSMFFTVFALQIPNNVTVHPISHL